MPKRPRVRLLHWNAEEASGHLDVLRAARHLVDYEEQFRPALLKSWREAPPDAFVIDLSRLPSHGREIAIALRQSPRTRQIPIIFCCGLEEKVNRTRRDLPDAAYCTLANLAASVRQALTHRPLQPVQPPAMMDRYAARTVAQKLGIKEASTVALLNAPPNASKLVGPLPSGVEFTEDSTERGSVTLCFVHDPHSLGVSLSEVRAIASQTKLWILWRKGGSVARGDVTEGLVRESGLALGLVDYKICSVNPTWSAMLFARKK